MAATKGTAENSARLHVIIPSSLNANAAEALRTGGWPQVLSVESETQFASRMVGRPIWPTVRIVTSVKRP